MPHHDLITTIEPSAKSPLRGTIKIGKKPVATLPFTVIASLGLQIGQAWTPEVQAAVHEAVCYDKAFADAMNKIDKRACSVAVLRAKLLVAGHAEYLVDQVLSRLTELGALNDRALGEALIAEAQLKGPVAGPRLREKLMKHGLEESLIDELASSGADAPDHDATEEAIEFARKKLGTMSRFDRTTQHRRLYGLLARRGFEESVVEYVVEKVLGPEEF